MTRTAIVGASGYTALELAKILLRHPSATLVAATSRERQPLAAAHPSLAGRTEIVCEPHSPHDLKQLGVEVAFLALPHGASREATGALLSEGIKVIDLSADYRLKDPEVYQRYYGEPHGDLENLGHAVYGLPEFYAPRITAATLVANPGCYPQSAVIPLAPLLSAGAISSENIIVNSVSGVSGAGRTPKLATLFPECNESVTAYNVGTHRHEPEINQTLTDVTAKRVEVLFTPHLVPMNRGIHSTIYATPTGPLTEQDYAQIVREHYADAPFVRVRSALPATKDVADTNYLDIAVRVTPRHVVLLATLDNLVRGASGVAVQNLNLMCGFPVTAGLR